MSIKIYVKYVKNNRDFHTTKLNLPTGNLDSKTSMDVILLMQSLSHEFDQTILMITHNEEIARMADRIIRIEDGKVVSGGVRYAR
ncbi:Macrolide export ATP-binding/permease protein MacB [Blautia obeum]|uniref:Macrolide export ATP-binding/permease protein MacB n=1 Tax=Blautia obeum TaxID=40520 RepID=A0A174NIQ6_9FIRM|nr:Macrolide export ATP-binding/permease protein MacB [Blautia obeum]